MKCYTTIEFTGITQYSDADKQIGREEEEVGALCYRQTFKTDKMDTVLF